MFADFHGNAQIVHRLREMLGRERFPHAVVLAGARGAGKYTLALMLARAMNCLGPGPQGLKPSSLNAANGTAEAVPLPKPLSSESPIQHPSETQGPSTSQELAGSRAVPAPLGMTESRRFSRGRFWTTDGLPDFCGECANCVRIGLASDLDAWFAEAVEAREEAPEPMGLNRST